MTRFGSTFISLLWLAGAESAVHAESREWIVHSMQEQGHWQVGGQRVSYTLGQSSLRVAPDPGGDGKALCLAADFREPRRSYVSAYWNGGSVPGRTRSLSFDLHGNGSGRGLRVSIEDAAGCWFQRRLGVVDWEGWRKVTASVDDGAGWRLMRLIGQDVSRMEHPIAIRQISLLRKAGAPEEAVVYLRDLRAQVDLRPEDLIEAGVGTGRSPALHEIHQPLDVAVTLRSAAAQAVSGNLRVAIEDYFGVRETVGEGAIVVPAGRSVSRAFPYTPTRLGASVIHVTLETPDRVRRWRMHAAVTQAGREWPPEHASQFGCCASILGFGPERQDLVFRLNRDAGMRWARLGIAWAQIEPEPGQFAWNPAKTGAGVRGRALVCSGGPAALSVPYDPKLACKRAVTIAFWLRAGKANRFWQSPIYRAPSDGRRSYGVYLGRDSGIVSFTGSFDGIKRPYSDCVSGWGAWGQGWRHVAVVYSAESGKMTFHVDGKQVAAHTIAGGPLRDSGTPVLFGHHLDGMLDEVVLYARTLSTDEIAQLARKGDPSPAGLMGWWSFDDEGHPGRDSGPHGLHAVQAEPRAIQAVRLARKHGIRPLGLIGFPPRWASTAPDGAARPQTYKPKLDALARFVEAVTRQYRGLIDHWEIWNEPNIATFWMPEPDPEEFMDVVRTAYGAAKRGNPRCTVVTPALAGPGYNPASMAFLDRLIELGLPSYCDAISIHPYRHRTTPEASDLVGDIRHISDLSAAHGGRRPIWFSELCWVTNLPAGNTERRAARMLGRAVPLSLGTGLVERITWFRFHDPGVDRFYLEHNCSLCRHDLLPKPEYFAYRTCSTLLDMAEPAGRLELGDQAYGRVFRKDQAYTAVVWRPEGTGQVGIDVGVAEARVVDLMGNERARRTEQGILLLSIGEDAQFIVGLPRKPAGKGPLLSIDVPERVRPGHTVSLPVTAHNPVARSAAMEGRVRVADWGLDIPFRLVAPPAGERSIELRLPVPAGLPPGWREMAVTVRFHALEWTETLRLGVSGVVPSSGPIAEWRFDEGAGAVARDATGNGHDAAVQRAKWVKGRAGSALAFDGNAMLTVPDAPSLDLAEEVTVALWLKLTASTGTWQSLVTKFLGDQRRNYGIYLRPDATGPGFSASFANASYRHTDMTAAQSFEDGQWHHVAATVSLLGRRVQLFADGDLVAERTIDLGPMLTNDEPLRIGQDCRAVIDDVRLYARALTPEEARRLAGR